MGLSTYEDKRDFRRTPEPAPGAWPERDEDNPIFVIQEHSASSHHFDLRLEHDGVLVSWAVPKGPSTDPQDKRLAVRVEDHPLDYADFEGVIPEDEYGGGEVIVWDAGPYRLVEKEDGAPAPLGEQLSRGHAEVWLEGKKLRGGFALVHAELGGEEANWLLVKMDDEGADARRNPVSTERESVLSGRTVDEVAEVGAAEDGAAEDGAAEDGAEESGDG